MDNLSFSSYYMNFIIMPKWSLFNIKSRWKVKKYDYFNDSFTEWYRKVKGKF